MSLSKEMKTCPSPASDARSVPTGQGGRSLPGSHHEREAPHPTRNCKTLSERLNGLRRGGRPRRSADLHMDIGENLPRSRIKKNPAPEFVPGPVVGWMRVVPGLAQQRTVTPAIRGFLAWQPMQSVSLWLFSPSFGAARQPRAGSFRRWAARSGPRDPDGRILLCGVGRLQR